MRIIIINILFLILTAFYPLQQPFVDTQAKFQAMSIYSIAKSYLDWPSEYKSGNFIIAIAGKPSQALQEHLENISSTRTIGSQKIELRYIKSPEEIEKFHVVFVPRESPIPVPKLIAKCKTQSTLLITEKEGFAQQGAGISFVYQESKLKYEFNKGVIQKQKLTISSEIEKSSSFILVN